MSQHDYNFANQQGASFRTDLNNAMLAIVTHNSGLTAPSTTYAYMVWYDTTNGLLKMRNGDNNAWVTIGPLADTTKHEIYVNNTVAVTVDSTGMGINNTSPAYALDVDGDINLTGDVYINGSPYVPTVSAISQGNSNVTVTDAGSGAVTITIDGSLKVTVDSNGYVGINDGTPSYHLDVNGDINFTGTLRKNGSVASFVDRQAFTSNGTWTKPSFGTFALIENRGAGGSGGRGIAGVPGGGGGGGSYNFRVMLLSSLSATESVTVGTGGASKTSNANGDAGGDTTFGSHLSAFGGGGGAAAGGGGGGAGSYVAGTSATTITGGAAVAGGGGAGGTGGTTPTAGSDGGVNGGGGGGGADTLGQNTAGVGGRSVNGGGGGGGGGESTGGAAGGVSFGGGNGGAGGYDANNATAGSAPGGGGGGSETGNSGAGANGSCIVYVF